MVLFATSPDLLATHPRLDTQDHATRVQAEAARTVS